MLHVAGKYNAIEVDACYEKLFLQERGDFKINVNLKGIGNKNLVYLIRKIF